MQLRNLQKYTEKEYSLVNPIFSAETATLLPAVFKPTPTLVLCMAVQAILALFYLGLSRGIVSCIYLVTNYIKCTMIHNGHLQVHL